CNRFFYFVTFVFFASWKIRKCPGSFLGIPKEKLRKLYLGLNMKKIVSIFFAMLLFNHLYSNNINWSSPPTTLSGVNVNASDPQIAIDANGDVVAAWI